MATTDFNVNQDDLAFILRNIKVAEAHSGGMTLTAAIQAAYGVDANDANLLPAGLRTVTGLCCAYQLTNGFPLPPDGFIPRLS